MIKCKISYNINGTLKKPYRIKEFRELEVNIEGPLQDNKLVHKHTLDDEILTTQLSSLEIIIIKR